MWKKAQQVWSEVARQVGGQFLFIPPDKIGFGPGAGDPFFKIVAKSAHWIIRLDTFHFGSDGNSIGTRMRACYVSKDAFRFSIHRAGVLSHIGQLLGMQDVLIGDESFDRHFVVKTTSVPQIKKLLSDSAVKSLFESQPWPTQIEARDDDGITGVPIPPNVDELYFHDGLVITDSDRLHNLFKLFTALLQRLLEIGSISDVDPAIEY